ncbi:hypothetical protein B0T10DRAFT_495207 [Thelonectria olida]|uniref:Cyclin-D1-binding protein 1-like N-terminal domain-containing protein n=1 Tax=Thelonectria olida TaxID=1576542 RepID=A0A9P8VWG2_9HYPO|nr:hypothetical protein B0T10DRAFT_495207 [Thelonectria olida]
MAPTHVEALKAMNGVVETTTALLQQLGTVLGNIHKGKNPPPVQDTENPESAPSNIDALALARDSASLIRAHSTKLSLLIINEPFTPSAISTVIRELVAGPIPGLASSLEVCDANVYTSVLRRELAYRAQRVFIELGALVQKVPKDGKVLSGNNERSFSAGGKGSLASTGVLWSACDDVAALATMGVGGFFVKKAQEWRDTLKDVMEEMKEWGEEEPDDDDEGEDDIDDLADQLGASHLSKQEMLDDLMNSSEAIPRDDPDGIRPRLETSLKRLRLVVLLYTALSKRRFKKLPPFPPKDSSSNPDLAKKLDETAKSLEQLPDKFGDLAAAFYSLDADEIDETVTLVFAEAVAVSKLLSATWDGKRDEFTDWTDKFESEIKKT